MIGYIAVTDPGWYQQLLADPSRGDANFWKPSPKQNVRLDTGTPFFFKLKAPANAIAGFGYFVSFTVLPDWLAWDAFGTKNGAQSFAELRSRLTGIRERNQIAADPQGRIGCSLIAEATFFDREYWVAPPSKWKHRTVQGARLDLTEGEGLRIWSECQARASAATTEPAAIESPAARFGTPTLHTPRLGQGIFRVQVLDAYDRACAVTGEHSLPALDAAHIRPYAQGGHHAVENGLALRADLHRLFDRGYVTVDQDDRFIVGQRLKDDFENGRSYYPLSGTQLRLPDGVGSRPDRQGLAWHRDVVYLG